MSTLKKFERTQERDFSGHHMLLRVAKSELAEAEKNKLGRIDRCLVAMTFSALACEALANAIGERIVDSWNDFESLSPKAKIRMLSERLGLPYLSSAQPWLGIHELAKFRNLIVHAKPEKVIEKKSITEEEYNSNHIEVPLSKLEKQITVGNARRAIEAVEAIKTMLFDKLQLENKLGIWSDGWSGSTRLMPNTA